MTMVQRDPYTNRRKTIVKDGVAVRDYWAVDLAGNRCLITKGTKVNDLGLPIDENQNRA